jgi:hypothetical protein
MVDNRPGEVVRPELGPCWPFLGARTAGGYGVIWWRGRLHYAHRVALGIARGWPLGPDEIARHRCDYPACIRPRHLVAGTRADNYADMIERDRIGREGARWTRTA